MGDKKDWDFNNEGHEALPPGVVRVDVPGSRTEYLSTPPSPAIRKTVTEPSQQFYVLKIEGMAAEAFCYDKIEIAERQAEVFANVNPGRRIFILSVDRSVIVETRPPAWEK